MTATDANAMHDERRRLLALADKIVTRAKGNGRLSAEDQAEFDRLHDRAAELHSTIQKAAKPAPVTTEAERALRQAAAVATLDRPLDTPDGITVGVHRGRPLTLPASSPAARRASAEYAAAFRAFVRGHKDALAGLTTDPEVGGSNLAPPQYALGVVKGLEDGRWFRRLATVRPPTTAPSVSRASRTIPLTHVAWAEQLPDYDPANEPKFGRFTLIPHYQSIEIALSFDLANRPDAADAIAAEMTAAFGVSEEAAFVAGDGVQKPIGLFHPTDQGIPAANDVVANPASIDAWIDARLSLRAVYLRSPSLRWVMRPSAFKVAAKLKDSAGAPILSPARRAGEPDTIGGVAVELTDDAPAGTGANGAFQAGDYFAVLGDLAMYDVQDGLDFGVTRHHERGDSSAMQVRYIARRKVDGCPRVPEAFRRLKVAA